MALHYRTQGFVLKKENLREADQVFTVFTKDFGKLKIVGKAIRKIKSKLRSGADLFYLSEIEFIQGKTHKTLTDAIVIDKFKNIRQDLEKLEIANQIAEVSDELIRGQEKDEKIWDLLSEVFNKLKIENCKLKIIYHYFIWNLLAILGYQMDLYHCAVCQKKLTPEKLYFNPEEGGITCCEGPASARPGRASAGKEQISSDVIKILRIFLNKDWEILSRLKIEGSLWKELEKISACFLDKIIA